MVGGDPILRGTCKKRGESRMAKEPGMGGGFNADRREERLVSSTGADEHPKEEGEGKGLASETWAFIRFNKWFTDRRLIGQKGQDGERLSLD